MSVDGAPWKRQPVAGPGAQVRLGNAPAAPSIGSAEAQCQSLAGLTQTAVDNTSLSQTSLERVQRFLGDLERPELAALLEGGMYAFVTEESDFLPETIVEVSLAPVCADAVRALSPEDRKRIAEGIAESDAEAKALGVASHDLEIRPDEAVTVNARLQLLADLVVQRGVMIDVATKNVLIKSVEDYYRARRKRLGRALESVGLPDPVPFDSLWDWYGHWSKELPSYRERRSYVRGLFGPTIEKVLGAEPIQPPERVPTGWERVDRALQKARHRFAEARNEEEDWQGVGLLCREALISLAQAVYVAEKHPTTDGVAPSSTDAKRMLEAFIMVEVPGEANEAIRRHAKASLSLASDLVHARTADKRRAQLCLEATQSTASVIAILSGRTDSSGPRAS